MFDEFYISVGDINYELRTANTHPPGMIARAGATAVASARIVPVHLAVGTRLSMTSSTPPDWGQPPTPLATRRMATRQTRRPRVFPLAWSPPPSATSGARAVVGIY